MKQKHNSLNNRVFKDNIDLENFKILLDSLNHVKPVYISREEYTNLNGDILKITGTDKIGEFYDLYLPNDLKVGELLNIINFLTTKFNIKKYVKIEELISKTKAVIGLITRSMSETESDEYIQKLIKEYNLDENFVYRIMGQKVIFSHGKEILTQIKSKRKTKTSKKLGTKEDINSSEEILSSLYQNEFDLTFFRKGVNMLRLGMMTITSGEIPNIRKKDGDIQINVNPRELDKQERLLRDKIGIETLKKELQDSKKSGNQTIFDRIVLKSVNKILKTLHEYPYQLTENDFGFKPSKILEKKELYCIGFSILGHAFLQELGIEHYGLNIPGHSALEIIIGKKRYYFDATSGIHLFNIKTIKKSGVYEYVDLEEAGKKYINKGNPEVILFTHIINNIGVNLSDTGKLNESISLLKQILSFNPNEPSVYKHISDNYFILGEYNQAIDYIKIALDLNPNDADSLNAYGINIAELGYIEESIGIFEKVIKYDKDFVDGYRNLGISFFKLKKYNEALNSFNKALKIDFNDSRTLGFKGLVLGKLKNYKDAFYCFDKSLKINPKDTDCYFNKGEILEEYGKCKLAKLYYFVSDFIEGKNKEIKDNLYFNEILKFINSNNFDGLRIYLLSLEKNSN